MIVVMINFTNIILSIVIITIKCFISIVMIIEGTDLLNYKSLTGRS